MKITFGKFDVSAKKEGGTAEIYANGVKVAWIERLQDDANFGTSVRAQRLVVTGYEISVYEGPESAPLLPLDGRIFDKLRELRDAVKAAYAPRQETQS